MNHLEASAILSEAESRSLSPETARALDLHLAECEACREWLATYRFLAGSFPKSSSPAHLPSEDLCAHALGSVGLSLDAKERCERHLESCPECAEEVALVRAAAAAQESSEYVPSVRTPAVRASKWFPSHRRLALIATVVIAVGAWLIVSGKEKNIPESCQMRGQSVRGLQSVEAADSILVEATEIEAGSVLSLESELVVFGNGFKVESGASLVVSDAPR